jgi:hypothetical protein
MLQIDPALDYVVTTDASDVGDTTHCVGVGSCTAEASE